MRMESKEWLEQKYLKDKLSCVEISKLVKKDPKSVWSWLKKYEIPTRKRGAESSTGTFTKGHKKGIGRIHTNETKAKIRDARIKDGHVPYLNKDGVHWLKGKSGSIHTCYKGGLTPERQSHYSSLTWAESVKQVWKRDNAICQRCNKNHNTETNRGNFHIHHIVSFQVKELRSELSNLILLCKECHRWVHSKKNTEKQFIKTI
jgi:5-methylcytosine-specific restriction endonuclease McrA